MKASHAHALGARLETPRLVLEPITGAHAEALFSSMQAAAIYEWIGALPPADVEALRQRWTRVETRLSPDGQMASLGWAARLRSDGVYVGKLDAEVDDDHIAVNVGYLFFPPFWGQGYATEALSAIVDSLERQGVIELRATVTRGNEASERVLVKAGFVRTRVIPENDEIRGVKVDDVEYVRRHETVSPPDHPT